MANLGDRRPDGVDFSHGIAARLPTTVLVLGFASFLTDFSSEMIYPLLPVFLLSVLGAGPLALGTIEGIAETTATLLKVVSGWWTDRLGRRKPFVVAGYGLAGMVRPLIGLASSWFFVLGIRFLDRVGKGLRTSPRDALIADVTPPGMRGRAFGFHRSLDHAGAVVGPLVAALLLSVAGISMRAVFLLAVIPAAAVIVVLAVGIREVEPAPLPAAGSTGKPDTAPGRLPRDFKLMLGVLLIFTLGNSTDAFLLLRMSGSGVPATSIAILWSAHHAIKMASTYVFGTLGDRIGYRPMIQIGWLVYALVYLAFATMESRTGLISAFLIYGLYYGLTEPAERAWISRLAQASHRGRVFGYYHAAIGLAALPASLVFGLLWKTWGVVVPFAAGAGLAAAAAVALWFVSEPPRTMTSLGTRASS